MRRRPVAPSLLTMLRDSIATPTEAAERLLALRPRTRTVFEGAVLVATLDALSLGLLTGGGFEVPLPSGTLVIPPLGYAAVLVAFQILWAGVIEVGGRLLGGRGRFAEALLVIVWLEVLSLVIGLLQLVLISLLPGLAPLLALLGIAVLLWCLVHFTRALHGFAGYGRTILSLILGALVTGLALSLLLASLGLGVAPDV